MRETGVSEPTRDEVILSMAEHRNYAFAHWLALSIGMAAETHPEEMRKALGSVFDLGLVEDYARRSMAVVTEAQRHAQQVAAEVRELAAEVTKDIEELEKSIDLLHSRIRKGARAVDELARRQLELAKRQRAKP
jgi:cell division protein FtsB